MKTFSGSVRLCLGVAISASVSLPLQSCGKKTQSEIKDVDTIAETETRPSIVHGEVSEVIGKGGKKVIGPVPYTLEKTDAGQTFLLTLPALQLKNMRLELNDYLTNPLDKDNKNGGVIWDNMRELVIDSDNGLDYVDPLGQYFCVKISTSGSPVLCGPSAASPGAAFVERGEFVYFANQLHDDFSVTYYAILFPVQNFGSVPALDNSKTQLIVHGRKMVGGILKKQSEENQITTFKGSNNDDPAVQIKFSPYNGFAMQAKATELRRR